jgi:hypothetical protein
MVRGHAAPANNQQLNSQNSMKNIFRNLALGLALSLPSLAFAQGTYLSAPDGDPVRAVVVDNSGSVGIGTTTPRAKLTLGRPDSATPRGLGI